MRSDWAATMARNSAFSASRAALVFWSECGSGGRGAIPQSSRPLTYTDDIFPKLLQGALLAGSGAPVTGQPYKGGRYLSGYQNLLLSARAYGYGGVLTTTLLANEGRLSRALGLPDDIRIAALVPIGRPAHGFRRVRRRSVDEVVFTNRFGTSPPWLNAAYRE